MPHDTQEKRQAYMAQRYQEKRDELIAYQSEYRKTSSRLQDRQRFRYLTGTAAMKMALVLDHGGCCQTCGESDWRVLQFHHRDPEHKEFCVTRGSLANVQKLREEAAKCDLLCGHCHTRLHITITEEEVAQFVLPMAERLRSGTPFDEARQSLWPERTYQYPRKFPLEDVEKIRDLYWEKEMTLAEIAELYDATATSLHTFMRKMNIPLRNAKQAAELRSRQLIDMHLVNMEDVND